MEKNLKTIRIGNDTIVAFYGTESRSIEREENPSFFDSLIELIKLNNESKIIEVIFNIEKAIEEAFYGKIKIKDGKAFYEEIELPQIASNKIIELHTSGEKDFSPIERFYEKLMMSSKNLDKINEVLNTIISRHESKIFFTKSGNLIVQSMIDPTRSKKTIIRNRMVEIVLFDKEQFGHDSNGEYYLISPIDILRIGIAQKYVFEGAIAPSQGSNENEPEDCFDFKTIILNRARKLRRFNEPKGIFAEDEFEDLYDIRFEFMKELGK